VVAGLVALALFSALHPSGAAHRAARAAAPHRTARAARGAVTRVPAAARRRAAHVVRAATIPHLAPPERFVPLPGTLLPGEGGWRPYGRKVGGMTAVYEMHLATGPAFPGAQVGIAWMDTSLLRATLYSGSTIPGGGPYRHSAPVGGSAARTLVAAFNAGFLMDNTNGGYFTDGKVVAPLRVGAASAVIYKSGRITVGMWGRDVRMTRAVAAVRQNLNLLVDHGRPVPGLNPNDTSVWGYTLGNQAHVWRSGLGVTPGGALVYVAGADLDITELADLLVRAGSVWAMELDINTDAVSYSTYNPTLATGAASPSNGTDLVAGMVGTPARYFYPWWSRDFFTMSARTTR